MKSRRKSQRGGIIRNINHLKYTHVNEKYRCATFVLFLLLVVLCSCNRTAKKPFSFVDVAPEYEFYERVRVIARSRLHKVISWMTQVIATTLKQYPQDPPEKNLSEVIDESPPVSSLTVEESALLFPAVSGITDVIGKELKLESLLATKMVNICIHWLIKHKKTVNFEDTRSLVSHLVKTGPHLTKDEEIYASALVDTLSFFGSRLTEADKDRLSDLFCRLLRNREGKILKFMILSRLGSCLPDEVLLKVVKDTDEPPAVKLYAFYVLAKRTGRRRYLADAVRLLGLIIKNWPEEDKCLGLDYQYEIFINRILDMRIDPPLRGKPLRCIPWLAENYPYLYWDGKRFKVDEKARREGVAIDSVTRKPLSEDDIAAVRNEARTIAEVSTLLIVKRK